MNELFLSNEEVIILVKHPEKVNNSDAHETEVSNEQNKGVFPARWKQKKYQLGHCPRWDTVFFTSHYFNKNVNKPT